MTPETAQPGEVNYDPVDRFTFVHTYIGALYALVGIPFWGAAVLGVGWELVERPATIREGLKKISPKLYVRQDTAENALWDTVAVMGGWYLGNLLRRKAP